MSGYNYPILNESLSSLCEELQKNTYIDPKGFENYNVKRGLRNADGTGVMVGLTKVCSVEGYYVENGERVAKDGKLFYRGYDVCDIVANCRADDRFGFEECCYLLLFGHLPAQKNLDRFNDILSKCRPLPADFIEDMIMKAPSDNVMNKLARAVLALYSYDENSDDLSIENVLRQSILLIAQLPTIMACAYQVKRWNYDHKSMHFHHAKPEHHTAEAILNFIRSDKKFTDREAKLLDMALVLHAEHGGGNNSTFATRVLSSSGTDTYSAIAAGIGSLKGPKHGGANLKVAEMIDNMMTNIKNIADEGQVADYLAKMINRQAGDMSGLVYGMGHAVYTISDPRSGILKNELASFVEGTEYEAEFNLLDMIERLTPEIFLKEKGNDKKICANVDLYSGLLYKTLKIPQDLYTPLFTVARVSGWCAHRIEEILTGGRIIRPAYKSMSLASAYTPLEKR